MATDPFDAITDLSQEIGQSTYVELIYTERRTGKTIKPSLPNVRDSLRQVAFKKKAPEGSHDPANPGTIVAIPQYPPRQYSLTASNQSVSRQKIANLGFKDLVKNLFIPQDIDCAITNVQGEGCDPSGCKIDIIFVIDTSSSMTAVIDDLKESISTLVSSLDTTSGNYRFGLILFSGSTTTAVSLDVGCVSSTNEAYTTFTNALNAIVPAGGGVPADSDDALESAITGGAGLWREDAYKVAILLTDTAPGGTSGAYSDTTQDHADTVATEAGSCGVNVIAVNCLTGIGDATVTAVMENYAAQSNGRYVELSDGTNLPAYVNSFFRLLCDPIDTDCENQAVNGSFDSTISGWQIDGSASWSSVGSNGFMILSSGTAEQTISDLIPGSRVRLRATVAGIEGSGNVYVALNDTGGAQPLSGGLNIYNGVVIERDTIVPPNGIVTITIENRTTPTTRDIYVDEINLCQVVTDECGFGSINLVTNSEFSEGVDDWTDSDDVPLDSTSWDSTINALIVETGIVRHTIDNLEAGQNLVLSFQVYDNQPSSNNNLEFNWTVLDNNDVQIDSGTIVSKNVTFPTDVKVSLTLPDEFEGPLRIEFASGGTAKVKSVYVCYPGGYCDSGMTKLSFDQFDTSRGAWAGGTLTDGAITVLSNQILQQTYFELTPLTILHFSVNCRTEGGVIVEFFYTNNQTIDQFFSDETIGIKSFETRVPDGTERVTVRIRPRTSTITVDDILLCEGTIASCDNYITDLRTYIEWNGIPRTPTNIFNMVARFTYRDPNDPFSLTVVNSIPTADGRWGSTTPTGCGGLTTCDFWKQNGNGGILQDSITSQVLTPATAKTIEEGDIVSLRTRNNWLWSIPASSNGIGQDGLVTLWDNPPKGLLQSVEILFLVNNIYSMSPTDPVCPGTFECATDPADSFDLIIRYTNNRGLQREFRKTFQRANLYQVATTFTDPPWDTISSFDYGIKGTNARWESALFELDTVDGNGLDQCTEALFFSAVGRGTLVFPKFTTNGQGQSAEGCGSTVTIEELVKGISVDEVQSIVLPDRSGGRWAITFTFLGEQNIIHIPWNVNPNLLRVALATLPLIRDISNLTVTGTGWADDPFIITFTNELGGRRIALLDVDASGLTGTGAAVVTQLVAGTRNERQTISKQSGFSNNLVVTFNGVSSNPIPFNATLTEMATALKAMSSIGNNIYVTGDGVGADDPYQGPWHINFIGTFAAQNVPSMTTTSFGYSITTDWQGGVGTNEIQQITVHATAGTYVLSIPNPNPTGGFNLTAPIAYNASSADVSTAITDAAPWLVGNIKVTKLAHDPDYPDRIQWNVEYKGTYSSTPMLLMIAVATGLSNITVSVKELVRGGGVGDKQRVTVFDSTFGSYKLNVTTNNSTEETPSILWNATASDIQAILANLDGFVNADDVTVVTCNSTEPKAVRCYVVTFHPRFGDVETMSLSDNQLSCNPLGLGVNQPPPYLFDLPECEIVSCIPAGACGDPCRPVTICKPGDGDEAEAVEPCCDQETIADESNVYSELVLQRELFDPNQKKTPGGVSGDVMAIKDLAVLRGLRPSNFNAYLRNFSTGVLTAVDFATPVETKMSVVLILKDEDTTVGRRRLTERLRTGKNILPSRMTWETVPT